MRRPIFIKPNNTDILILDKVGSEYLIRWCFPERAKFQTLETRNTIPIILSLEFFLLVFKSLLKMGLNRESYLENLIMSIKPKIVITYIDNMKIFGEISSRFNKIRFLSVQNGTRSNRPSSNGGWSKTFKVPKFFGFGFYEIDLMQETGVNVEQYHYAGSLKLGIFLSNYSSLLSNSQENTISFISQYSENAPGFETMKKIIQEVFIEAHNAASERRLDLQVLMRYSNNKTLEEREVEFYKSLLPSSKITFIQNNPLNFSSYKSAYLSKMILTVDSTLGFEMLGCMRKVCFCSSLDPSLASERGIQKIEKNLPEIIKLDREKSIKRQILELIDMDNYKYELKVKESSQYFMRSEKPFPHELIKTDIEYALK